MGITDARSVGDLLTSVRPDRPVAEILASTELRLWVLMVLFFCVGDLVTTHVGLSMPGIVEAGPLVGPVLEAYGPAAMVVMKGATVALFYGLYRVVPEPHSLGVPLGLAVVGVLVTAWNLVVIGLSVL
ncbi:MAG: hypothetical protein R3324_12875 [Halobacteriales archaeon]|nr:hypothetical protein [Halobacteriales archaeon]